MACDGVDCAVGERCEAGACVDRCAGAVCPVGSRCAQGVCELVELTEEEIAALAEDAMTPDVGEGGDDEATPGVAPDAGAAGAGQDDSAGAGKGESPSGAPIRVSVDSRSDETASCGLGAAGSTRTGQGLLWLLPLLALGRLWRAWRASAGPRVGRGRAGSAG